MAVCELHYKSEVLEKATSATILLPEGAHRPPFAVMYLLHGLSDDSTGWTRRTSIERYAEPLPLMVVMPDGGRGFYCDAVEGCRYETALAVELVDMVDRYFPTKASRDGRCVCGLSMGGYGAIRFGLRHADRFVSASSHSGALMFGHYPLQGDDAWAREFRRIIGPDSAGSTYDLTALADAADPAALPAVRIDCGVDDFLIDANRAFHAHLDGLGIAHEYEEHPGEHNWAYWDLHVQDSIAFHARILGIAPPASETGGPGGT